MSTMKTKIAATASAVVLSAGLLSAVSAPQADAASSARVTNKSSSVSTIQVAPCNRSKSSCSITDVLLAGETGPKGSYWAYVQPGYKASRVGGTRVETGGHWFDSRYAGLSTQWVVSRA